MEKGAGVGDIEHASAIKVSTTCTAVHCDMSTVLDVEYPIPGGSNAYA
jgi:hypothetical protein